MTTKRKAYVVSAASYGQAIAESVRLKDIIQQQEAGHRSLQAEVRGLMAQLDGAHANVKHLQTQRAADNNMIISMQREITELQQVIREQRARYDAAVHLVAVISGKDTSNV